VNCKILAVEVTKFPFGGPVKKKKNCTLQGHICMYKLGVYFLAFWCQISLEKIIWLKMAKECPKNLDEIASLWMKTKL